MAFGAQQGLLFVYCSYQCLPQMSCLRPCINLDLEHVTPAILYNKLSNKAHRDILRISTFSELK
jgi:hypothetical protein